MIRPDKIKLRDATTENPIMLIDGSPLLYINGNRPNYKECIDQFMQEFSGICKSDRYIGVIDNGKSFRTQIVSTYKASRPSKDSILDKYPYLYRVKEYLLNQYKFNLIDDIEGDDAIAIINRRLNPCYSVTPIDCNGKPLTKCDSNNVIYPVECYRTRYNTVMISIDKDFLQLAGVHLNIKTRVSHVVYPSRAYIDTIDGKLQAISYLLMYAQTMMGDSADNIKGLSKYGPVKASKVLQNVTCESEAQEISIAEYAKVYSLPGEDHISEFNTTLSLVKLLVNRPEFKTPSIETIPIIEHDEPTISDISNAGSVNTDELDMPTVSSKALSYNNYVVGSDGYAIYQDDAYDESNNNDNEGN